MQYSQREIKKGIKVHKIYTDKFKTNLVAVFLTTKLTRENVTKNAMISTILRRGSKNMNSQEEISKQMEEMYGASFDCGLDKTGDNQILKFYIENVNDDFIPEHEENMLKNSIQKLLEIVFNPYIENGEFKKEYVEQEKSNIKQKIEGKIDNKAIYALNRCIEEMYENEPFGLFKFGYVEDLEKIDSKNLYEYYKKLIKECKIDIFVSGILPENLEQIIEENESISELEDRNPDYIVPSILDKKNNQKENVVAESMDVTQGKLVLGLDVNLENENQKYDALLYNSILGGTANSKLFQNVREKANLAYVASSSYSRQKNNIFINCGIEIANYNKALDIVKKQIEDMKKGDFSEEDIENAKKGIISTINLIDDEQDTAITYYFGQELSEHKIEPDEYKQKIEKIQKEDIVKIAKSISINTIYFLKD